MKYRLTLKESLSMIDDVYNSVFDFNADTGEISYYPELYRYSLFLAVLTYYCDYVIKDDIEENYLATMDLNTNELDIDVHQFNLIEEAIDEKIEMTKSIIAASHSTIKSEFDTLIPHITNLIDVLSKKIEDIDIDEINDRLSNLNVDNLIDAYENSSFAKSQNNEVLDSKNARIRYLEKELKKKNAKDSKNSKATVD